MYELMQNSRFETFHTPKVFTDLFFYRHSKGRSGIKVGDQFDLLGNQNETKRTGKICCTL